MRVMARVRGVRSVRVRWGVRGMMSRLFMIRGGEGGCREVKCCGEVGEGGRGFVYDRDCIRY
jgi:hypothetical protein